MRVIIPSFLCLLSLTACLKQNYPAGNSSAQSNTIRGAIVMRDWHGKALEKPVGHVLAQFAKPTANSLALSEGLRLPGLVKNKNSVKGPSQCQVIHEPKTGGEKAERSRDVILSVGKVLFGTSANNLVPLLEGENHLYKLDLQPDFASGIYFAAVEGTTATPQFSVKMSMPERMGHVMVAGQDFETSATAFRKGESLKLSWDAPTGEFDLKINQMELEVSSENDKEVVTLVCGVMEKDLLTNSSTVNWEIPSNYLQALDATPSGLVMLKRGQWMKASSPEVGVVSFEGVRTYATQALISE
jgi:hypothetical protein